MAKLVDLLDPIKKSSNPNYRTLKLSQVFRETPDRYKTRAFDARIKSLKLRKSRSTGQKIILSIIYTVKDSKGVKKQNPDMHYQYIEQLEGSNKKYSKMLWNSQCKVSCSCLDFLFTDEVSLFSRSNADINFSNGELPVIKNPQMVPQVCKHLSKLILTVRHKGW